MLVLKRVYEPPSPEDGQRILVDRLWPRGLTKDAARIDLWLKDVSPSTTLRQRVHSGQATWSEFQQLYWAELREQPKAIVVLRQAIETGNVTLLYAVKDETLNNAVALKAFLEQETISD